MPVHRPNRRRPAVRAMALHRPRLLPTLDREVVLGAVALLLLAAVLLIP
jgi:hypothetical protein